MADASNKISKSNSTQVANELQILKWQLRERSKESLADSNKNKFKENFVEL